MSHDYIFTRGVVVRDELAFILSFVEPTDGRPVEMTQLIQWTPSEVGVVLLDWQAVGLDVGRGSPQRLFVVGADGRVLVGSSAGIEEELISVDGRGPGQRGILRGVRVIGEDVYAFGMDRQLYQRREDGWREIEIGGGPGRSFNTVSGITAIDGFGPSEVYAAGWSGEMWRYDGQHWTAIETPTNLKIEHVTCGGDGRVYAVGQAGLLMAGREDTWHVVEQEGVADQFWGSCWFADRLWVATATDLFYLQAEDALVRVEPDGVGRGSWTTGWLTATPGMMWSIGATDIFRTEDGLSWTPVDFSEWT